MYFHLSGLAGLHEPVDYVPEYRFQNCDDIRRTAMIPAYTVAWDVTQSIITNVINYRPNWSSISPRRQRYNGSGTIERL